MSEVRDKKYTIADVLHFKEEKEYIKLGVGVYDIQLDQLTVANLRNKLTYWLNDKRTREQKRDRAQELHKQ